MFFSPKFGILDPFPARFFGRQYDHFRCPSHVFQLQARRSSRTFFCALLGDSSRALPMRPRRTGALGLSGRCKDASPWRLHELRERPATPLRLDPFRSAGAPTVYAAPGTKMPTAIIGITLTPQVSVWGSCRLQRLRLIFVEV